MDGSDMAFDYKAVAAGIARSEGMGALLPVVEKELLHYRILSAMQDGGFFGPIVFQGGTSLRLCHGSPRYSEDLDFAGGTGFGVDDLRGLGECVRSSLAGMSPDVQVKVREPVRDEGLVRRWCISSSRCFVFSHVFFSGLGSCMHFPYFSGCAEVFLPNMRASLTRRLWPVNSRSRPWCTMRSMIAAASLSSAKTVPHLLNSMFVVNMMLRLS